MTKKIKLFLLLLLISIIFLSSCDKDYEEDVTLSTHQNSNNSNLKVSKVYYKDFKNNINLLNKIEKSIGKPEPSLNQRTVYSSDNSFHIDTDFAYYIEDENSNHSYTFQIIRDNPQYLLENLILNSNNQNSYDLFIAQYNITEQEYIELENGHNPNLSSKVTLTPVNGTVIDVNSIFARGSAEGMCLTTTIIPGNTCPGPENHTLDDILSSMDSSGNSICPYFNNGSFTAYATEIIYSWGPCGEEEGGGGGYDNGDDPYTGGYNEGTGGTPTDNDNPENNDPNQNEDIEDTGNPVNTTPVTTRTNTPCEEISKIIEKPQFSINMLELKNNINGAKEKGFIIRDKGDTDAFSQVVEGDNDGNVTYPYADSTLAELDNLWKSIGTAHNHLISHIGVFTLEDLENLLLNGLLETHLQNPNKSLSPKKSIIFLITNKGLFSLKINDLNKLQSFCAMYASWSLSIKKAYLQGTFSNPKMYNITPNSSHDEQVTGFLRFIQDQDIGVDLYEGNADTFGEWKKLNLTENNGTFGFMESTPCNN